MLKLLNKIAVKVLTIPASAIDDICCSKPKGKTKKTYQRGNIRGIIGMGSSDSPSFKIGRMGNDGILVIRGNKPLGRLENSCAL